jgi:cysteine synthase
MKLLSSSKLARSSLLLVRRRPIQANGCDIRHVSSFENRCESLVGIRPSDLVGQTPLVDSTSILKAHDLEYGCQLYGMMDSMEPLLTVKESMTVPVDTESESTPGMSDGVDPLPVNTGITSALISRDAGYRCILPMSETVRFARRMIQGPKFVSAVKAIENTVPGAPAKDYDVFESFKGDNVILHQIESPPTSKANCETEGPRNRESTRGNFNLFMAGVRACGSKKGRGYA